MVKDLISIITPTHDPRFLNDLYESLLEQTNDNWEWVLVLNGGLTADKIEKFLKDERVKAYNFEYGFGRVGALKRFGFFKAEGEILLEMDHDDMLFPDALEELFKAFQDNPDCSMIYSNCANVNTDWSSTTWDKRYGWSFRDVDWKGHKVKEAISAPPTPHGLSRIWFAPNHLRAWPAKAYMEMGGHNPNMKISDDHDLICRSYLHGKIVHIDKCLYFYRIHGENTWLQNQAEIQTTMWENYDKYIYAMAEKWATDNDLLKIDLGGGISKPNGYQSIDLVNGDITHDLNKYPWPLKENSVGVLRAHDALEHLKNPIYVMNEAYRVLAHGGFFMISVPSTDGRGAFQDPTHISFWNENSFWYYTKSYVQKYIADKTNVRFQAMKVTTGYPSQWHEQHKIPYVTAHLIAVKDPEKRFYGDLEI